MENQKPQAERVDPYKPPCKNCPERHAGCFVTCEKFLKYQEAHRRELDRIRQEKDKRRMVESYMVDEKRKNIKKVNKR